jgi:hypothetical protein
MLGNEVSEVKSAILRRWQLAFSTTTIVDEFCDRRSEQQAKAEKAKEKMKEKGHFFYFIFYHHLS